MDDSESNSTSSTAFVERIAAVLARAGAKETRLVVAVSGGADSTALLVALAELRERLGLQLTVAHLDHGWRPESGADAEWVARLCADRQIEFVSRRLAVPMSTTGSESAARTARRRFLAETADSVGAPWIATAHTADDQVETVLHRLLRGTGPRGLAGMSVVSPLNRKVRIVRPLLDMWRSELQNWLTQRDQSWRIDITNSDTRYTRNRIRHELLPLLRESFNPQVDAAVLRLSRQCAEIAEWLRSAAEQGFAAARLDLTADTVRLQASVIADLPRPVVRELFVVVWTRLDWPLQSMGFDEWELLAASAVSGVDRLRFQLPGGIDVARTGGVLRLSRGA